MSKKRPSTSSLGRFVKMGGLLGRVGVSIAGNQLLDFARSDTDRQVRKTENLVRNATRVVETLGEMKGAAMKVGQMLSLHEGLLPAEVAAVLRTLQREAPRVPAEVMRYEIEGELENFDELFERLEPEAFAAASIGQVHEGRLRDGRRVAVKIQYPLIEEIIHADLDNLRRVLGTLFSWFSNADFAPVWEEVSQRLLEELDYTQEAENIRRLADLHRDVPEIIVPAVVEEATTRKVLTMEYVDGISPDDACTDRYEQELKDRWGIALFEFGLRGLLRHRLLHADPNLANFAFREDGRIVVYDFGCVKRIPENLARGYTDLSLAALEGRGEAIPGILERMGVMKENEALPRSMTDDYVEMFGEVFREVPPYRFGEDPELYERLLEAGLDNWNQARDIRFPRDIVFVNRTLGGHFGNLNRLRAVGPWRELVLRHARPAAS